MYCSSCVLWYVLRRASACGLGLVQQCCSWAVLAARSAALQVRLAPCAADDNVGDDDVCVSEGHAFAVFPGTTLLAKLGCRFTVVLC
jgi:hypothetical protein